MENTFILDGHTESVLYLCKKDKRLAKVISIVGPLNCQLSQRPYRFLIETIIGQMLSNKVADILCARLDTLCNGLITPKHIDGLTDDAILSIGISKSKLSYIRALTDDVKNGRLNLSALADMDDKDVIQKLTSVKGIGNWTAKMYLIFVLGREDVLPYEDMAFLQSYGWLYKTKDYSAASVAAKCKKWKPYASVAARFLYRALDIGLTKKPFHLYKDL